MHWASVVTLAATTVVLAAPSPRNVQDKLEFEYIVVGSGAGGGPLASRLAENGHTVLLIESGDDQSGNDNITVPGYQAPVTNDPKLRWDIFVNHYQDLARAKQDPKFVYQLPDGGQYVGLNPPAAAQPKGILYVTNGSYVWEMADFYSYPRAGTLGGCVSHNALIWILPFEDDWNNIASLTGDQSWTYENMRQYYNKVSEWQPNGPTDPTPLLRDPMLIRHVAAGATVAGAGPFPLNTLTGLGNILLNSPNDIDKPGRDSAQGFYNIPLIAKEGARYSVKERILNVANKNKNLTIRTNCLATKLIFSGNATSPTVTGVEFLDGSHVYKASPLSGTAGTPGSAYATREVILSGGTFNTPQLLKLSGIGAAEELKSFGIPVVKDLPGVGTNMQDRYEIPVNIKHENNFVVSDGCTFDMKPHDKCYQQWLNPNALGQRGAYASNGLVATMVTRSKGADNSNVDLFTFASPANFQGYFPGWADAAVADHKHFSWYTLKAQTRNQAGTVKLTSTDPRDQPKIDFNYFDTGTTADGADVKDLNAMVEGIAISRKALATYNSLGINLIPGSKFIEENPGPAQSQSALQNYVKTRAWGHHASCSCPIGADNDPMAVLDSQFRVRGVKNLRVVDASVFPKIPGIFIQAPIFIVAEKAADVISKSAATSDVSIKTNVSLNSSS